MLNDDGEAIFLHWMDGNSQTSYNRHVTKTMHSQKMKIYFQLN